MSKLPTLLLAGALLVACGGDDDDDNGTADATVEYDAVPAPDAPPAGPGLTVQGSFVVDNRTNSEAPDNTTSRRTVNASLRIERDGTPVTNAVVGVNPPQAFTTFLTGEPLDPSLYTGNYMGYFNDSTRVEISSDNDDIPESVIVGQSLFKITQPSPGAVVAPGDPIDVVWSRPGAAATVLRITTDGGHDSGELADTDTYTIPGTDVTLDTASDKIHVLRCRRNDSLPGDAANGSYIDFCVESELSFMVVAP